MLTSTRASDRTRRILSSVKSSGGSETPPPETAAVVVNVFALEFSAKIIPPYVDFVILTLLNRKASPFLFTTNFPVFSCGKSGGAVRWWYGNATSSIATQYLKIRLIGKKGLMGSELLIMD